MPAREFVGARQAGENGVALARFAKQLVVWRRGKKRQVALSCDPVAAPVMDGIVRLAVDGDRLRAAWPVYQHATAVLHEWRAACPRQNFVAVHRVALALL